MEKVLSNVIASEPRKTAVPEDAIMTPDDHELKYYPLVTFCWVFFVIPSAFTMAVIFCLLDSTL